MAKTYKSMQGKVVDIDLLRQRNELTPAVGNARVNARGDELGRGGKIVRTREQVLKDYYESSAGMPSETTVKKQPVAQETIKETNDIEEITEDWVEDEEGNFEKKTRTRSRSK